MKHLRGFALSRTRLVTRSPVAALLCSILAVGGCRPHESGSKLEKNVGDPDENSAAVANRLPAGVANYPSAGRTDQQPPTNPGVERGFSDASGGHSLTGHAPNGYPASFAIDSQQQAPRRSPEQKAASKASE
jgi:hypothetical protein